MAISCFFSLRPRSGCCDLASQVLGLATSGYHEGFGAVDLSRGGTSCNVAVDLSRGGASCNVAVDLSRGGSSL
jgi:hypothetical protein